MNRSSPKAIGNLLDGDVRIDAMLVEEIDGVHLEALERRVGHRPDVLRTTIDAPGPLRGRRIEIEAELGGDDHLAFERGQSLADQLLIRERAVDFGRVEEVDAKFHGTMDEFDHLLLVRRRTIAGAHGHAAEADGRDFEIAEFARLHRFRSLKAWVTSAPGRRTSRRP
jgi:hypothetical protein